MTCFWNGIISRLNKNDYDILGIQPIKKRNIQDIKNFIQRLKILSETNQYNIKWQNQQLTKSEIIDIKTFIKEYDINQIQRGHWTSSCDPFLCLITDLLKCKIIFNYCNNQIIFEYMNNPSKEIKFTGSRSHFS